MYEVGVRRAFIAQHYLVGGDWGRENQLHSHRYQLEVLLRGPELDHHGYLFDIAPLSERLDLLVEEFADKTLNDLRPFEGLNPSLEHFARIISERLTDLPFPGAETLTVRLWEDEFAWASHQRRLT